MHLPVKTIMGICTAVLVVGCLLVYVLGSGPGGFLYSFQDAGPVDSSPEDGVYKDAPGMEFLAAREKPHIKTKDQKVGLNESHPAASFVESATDTDGNDLMDRLKVKGDQLDSDGVFLADTLGTYIVTFTVTDDYGIRAEKNIRVIVEH